LISNKQIAMHIEMMRPLVLWHTPCKPNQLLMADKIFMKNDNNKKRRRDD
jgi:hypothetical protein